MSANEIRQEGLFHEGSSITTPRFWVTLIMQICVFEWVWVHYGDMAGWACWISAMIGRESRPWPPVRRKP